MLSSIASVINRRRFAALFSGDGKLRRSPKAALVTAAVGIAAVGGSGLGLWFLPSFSSSVDSDSAQRVESSSAQRVESGDASPKKKAVFLFSDSYRRRVFFNYEKRMRMRSPPEKIFEYFASIRSSEGDLYMTPADFMRAVVPVFPPSESNSVREGYLRGERPPGELHCVPSTFFMLFDTNNDGHISFPEYIFFVTLFSIPESNFSATFRTFDLDNSGEIGREEFKKVMSVMRSHNRQGSCHRDGLRTGLRVGRSVENAGLVEYFFGKDGKSYLQHDKFVQFLRELHDEGVYSPHKQRQGLEYTTAAIHNKVSSCHTSSGGSNGDGEASVYSGGIDDQGEEVRVDAAGWSPSPIWLMPSFTSMDIA